MKKFFATLMTFVLVIFSTSCGTDFKSSPKTLGVKPQEFDKRFIANVNALAESRGIDEKATTMGKPSITSKLAEQIIRYQFDEYIYLIETIDDKTTELKSVLIECIGGDLAEKMTAETAYVAAIKAVTPALKGNDFKKLQNEFFSESSNEDKKWVEHKGIYYLKSETYSTLTFGIFARHDFFEE